jgi:hypothetical protein
MAGSGPPSVDDLLKGFQQGTNIKYKIDLEKGIFEANDEADHARGMEAIDRAVEARKALQIQRLPARPKQVAVPSAPSA